MIGNDVVDLGDPDSRIEGHHAAFDRRVFTAAELGWIDRSASPERTRWSLWAAKESAFKAARRGQPGLVFSPSRFAVSPAPGGGFRVELPGAAMRVRLDGDDAFVHAVATGDAARRRGVLSAVASLPEGAREADAGAQARRLAAASIANELGGRPGDYEIVRDRRMPAFVHRGRVLPGTLSLSHHGRYVAFAWTPATGADRPGLRSESGPASAVRQQARRVSVATTRPAHSR